jgi:glycosyltransferase involved in cell wall biosynthesis
VLSASRLVFGGADLGDVEVRIVSTLMRAYPRPGARERIMGGIGRIAKTLWHLAAWRPPIVVAFCSSSWSYVEKSALLVLARMTGARTFLSPRSGYQSDWLAGSRWARFWLKRTAWFIDGYLVQSRYWRDLHAGYGIPEGKLHVWHNSVDTARWAGVATARLPCPPTRPFRFLFLAWAIPEKGLRELIQASEILNRLPGPSFEVAVAGDGPVGRELRERRRGGVLPPNVLLLEWVGEERRERELGAADALVLPTWTEGFPNVVLEAMACALPVIATPVGAIPDVVEDGITGLIVPVRSPERLAEAMDRLRRSPQEAADMGRRGLAVARSRFDVRTGVARFREILGLGS